MFVKPEIVVAMIRSESIADFTQEGSIQGTTPVVGD